MQKVAVAGEPAPRPEGDDSMLTDTEEPLKNFCALSKRHINDEEGNYGDIRG